MPYKDAAKRRQVQAESQARRRARAREDRLAHDAELTAALQREYDEFEYPADPIGALVRWSHDYLIVPPGHPKSGEPMTIPDFAEAYLRDAIAHRESLLCIARKNAKSAFVAVYVLGRLVGPIRIRGYRAGVVSVNEGKAKELHKQAQDIARASGVPMAETSKRIPRGGLKVYKKPAVLESVWGTVEILAADKAAGHASGFDDAIIDELGLLAERDRDLVNGMRSSVSAKDGRTISLTVRGTSPFVPELIRRKDDPDVAVHLYEAPQGCKLDDRKAWEDANPGLRAGIKSYGYMAATARLASVNAPDEPHFRLFDLNQKTDLTATRIVTLTQWERCEVLDEQALPERRGPFYLGVDFGGAASMTAAAAYWPNTGRLEGWGAFPDEVPLDVRGKSDGVENGYVLMHQAGELLVFEGYITPIAPFLSYVADALDGLRPRKVVSDRYRKTDGQQAVLDVGLMATWPWEYTPVGAGPQGGEDVRAFQKAVISRTMKVRKSLMWTQAIAQSKVQPDRNGNPGLDKSAKVARIDVLQAGVLAVGAAYRDGAKGPSRVGQWMAAAKELQEAEGAD